MKLFLLSFIIPCFFVEQSFGKSEAKKISIDTSIKSNEKTGLRYFVDNFIPFNTFARPFDKNLLEEKLKIWNPHIKDWCSVNYGQKFMIKRKNPIWEFDLGYNFSTNNEDLSNDNAIKVNNQETILSLKNYYFLSPSIFIHSWMQYKSQFDFYSESADQNYSFNPGYSLGSGIEYFTFKRWAVFIGGDQETFEYISIVDTTNLSQAGVLRNIEQAQANILWGTIAIRYRSTINLYGSYYSVEFSKSMDGTKSYRNSNEEISIDAIRLKSSWKQYWSEKYWTSLVYEFKSISGLVEYTRSSLGAKVGYTFW